MRIFVFIILLLLTLPLMAQRSKNKTEEVPPVAVSEGITYALPRTCIRIIIKAGKTTHIPGPYAMYAEPLLGIKDVIIQPQTVWEMKGISFELFAEPDPTQVFKTNQLTFPLIQLTSDGCLAGFNSPVQVKRNNKPVFNSLVFAGNGHLLSKGHRKLQPWSLNQELRDLIFLPAYSMKTTLMVKPMRKV
jgi:hypothetical protein